ncbi:hypothetical protein D6C92_01212 [Aureobasidium pullulans]|nr:hypothetical protein D6C92_01212 [Aureobasidium pullulans]
MAGTRVGDYRPTTPSTVRHDIPSVARHFDVYHSCLGLRSRKVPAFLWFLWGPTACLERGSSSLPPCGHQGYERRLHLPRACDCTCAIEPSLGCFTRRTATLACSVKHVV